MARLVYNDLRATLGGSLTGSATSVSFAAGLTYNNGTSVPTISGSDYIPLTVLDSSGNLSEVVWLTAYTSGATSGTIARGQENTTGVSHASGDKLVQAPTVLDLGFVGVKARRNTSYSLPTSLVGVPWNTEDFDTHSFHDNSTNPSRFTIPTGLDGYYMVGGAAGTASTLASSARFLVRLLKNGTEFAGTECAGGGVFPGLSAMSLVYLAAGDYVEMGVMIGSGSNTLNNGPSEFWMRRVG